MYSKEEKIIIDKFSMPNIDGIDIEELALKTNSEEISGTNEKKFFCQNGNFKFCLVLKKEGLIQPIFIMHFFKVGKRFQELRGEGPTITLELLWVVANFRRKHIATYYMRKLVQFAKEEGFTQIRIVPNPDAINFKQDNKENNLNREQLTYFYKKFEDEHLKITFI